MMRRVFPGLVVLTLVYTVFVILWGAFVRISGSGAGCGQHWPTCHGEIIPPSPSIATIIEFGHRLTSGLCGLLVLLMTIAAFSYFEKGHRGRWAAVMSLIFIITESLIGAALVLLEYVADNESYWRAGWMAVHLVNTLLLVAFIYLLHFRLSESRPIVIGGRGADSAWLRAAIFAMFVVSTTGAVTALGHTLFPEGHGNVVANVLDDPWAETPYPLLVRVVHPMVSMSAALLFMALCSRFLAPERSEATRRAALVFGSLVLVQTTFGVANIAFSAPGWMQLVHLLLANLVWFSLLAIVFVVGVEPVRAAGQA